MDYSLMIGICLGVAAITYGITAWAHRKGAPAAVVAAEADIRLAEDKVEAVTDNVMAAARRVEPAVKEEIGKIIVTAEDAAWATLQELLAKTTDLAAKKAAVAEAAADLAAHQKRIVELKQAVAALPQA